MNITLSARSKSLNSLPFKRPNSSQTVQKALLQQQSPISKTESLQKDHEYSHLPKWLMGKCFAKSNSILQQESSLIVHHHKKVIHDLSSKKAKQHQASPSPTLSPTISTVQSQNLQKNKSIKIKIKLEICKDQTKNERLLRFNTYETNMNSTALKNSCNSSTNASRQKLNDRIMKAIQKESQLKLPKSSVHLENVNKMKHIWQFGTEQKHKIQDCLYEPIFNFNLQTIISTGKTQDSRTESQKYDPSNYVCQDQVVVSNGQIQIIDIQNEEGFSKEKFVQNFSVQQKMFVIQEKNDESIQNQ